MFTDIKQTKADIFFCMVTLLVLPSINEINLKTLRTDIFLIQSQDVYKTLLLQK